MDVCELLSRRHVGARVFRRRHGGALPWRLRRGDALVSWWHHGVALPLSWRHTGARLNGRHHGDVMPCGSHHDGARVRRWHHGGVPPLLLRHIGARLFGWRVSGALPWRSRHNSVRLRRRHHGGVLPLSPVVGRGGEHRRRHARRCAPPTTRHPCTRCHGWWSVRCRPHHGASNIGLEEPPWQSWRNRSTGLGGATAALCTGDRATTAHVYVGGTTTVLCQ